MAPHHLPGKSHGRRKPGWGLRRAGHTLNTFTFMIGAAERLTPLCLRTQAGGSPPGCRLRSHRVDDVSDLAADLGLRVWGPPLRCEIEREDRPGDPGTPSCSRQGHKACRCTAHTAGSPQGVVSWSPTLGTSALLLGRRADLRGSSCSGWSRRAGSDFRGGG